MALPESYAESRFAARGLSCVRGDRLVFHDVSFSLGPGDALRLTGANGSGKSSLLRTVAGLLPAAAGAVLWNGEDIARDREAHGARLLYAGHLDAVKPWLTVAENVAFWAGLWDGPDEGEAVGAALATLAMEPAADLPARLLSAGQRRRVALARLAVIPAPLWLLDEPTASLDTASVARVVALVAGHRARGGMAVVATHTEFALPGADELALGAPAAAGAGGG